MLCYVGVSQDVSTPVVDKGSKVRNINSDAVEYAPSISADGKTMVFEANITGRYELYEAKFENGEWSAPISIDSVNNYGSPNDLIGGPSISFDGNTLFYFSSFSGGMGAEDIYYSVRTERGWSRPKNIGAPINSSEYEGFPSISADGKSMYFVRFKPEGPRDKELKKIFDSKVCYTIYQSNKQLDGTWSKPIPLPEPINEGCEKAPRIMADNRTLIFSSYKLDGKGSYDMYQSQLNDAGDWGTPIPLDFLNSEKSDQFASISAQGDKLFYAYNSQDIYEVSIPEEFQQFRNNVIQGYVKNHESNNGIAAEIFVRDAYTSEEVMQIQNNPIDGRYSIVLATGRSYTVEYRAEGYTTYVNSYDLSLVDEYREIQEDVTLYESSQLYLNIYDGELYYPIETDIEVVEKESGTTVLDTVSHNVTGSLKLALSIGKIYQVNVNKQDFYSQSFDFDLSGLIVFPEFEKDIELLPIKEEVEINISDLTNNRKVRSRVRIRNRNRDEVIDIEGNQTVALRVGDRYEIEATSDQGYAFNSTVIDVGGGNNPEVALKLQPLLVGTNLTLKDILFESNSDQLTESSSAELNRVVGLMHNNPTLEVEIAAHTDDVGSGAYNKLLSERRAQSVVAFLIENEIADQRFQPVGYGEDQPLVPNDNDENRAKNRRVILKILAI